MYIWNVGLLICGNVGLLTLAQHTIILLARVAWTLALDISLQQCLAQKHITLHILQGVLFFMRAEEVRFCPTSSKRPPKVWQDSFLGAYKKNKCRGDETLQCALYCSYSQHEKFIIHSCRTECRPVYGFAAVIRVRVIHTNVHVRLHSGLFCMCVL